MNFCQKCMKADVELTEGLCENCFINKYNIGNITTLEELKMEKPDYARSVYGSNIAINRFLFYGCIGISVILFISSFFVPYAMSALIICGIVFGIIAFFINKGYEEIQKIAENCNESSEKSIIKSAIVDSYNFYKKCFEDNVSDIDNPKFKEKAKGYLDYSNAVRRFNIGRRAYNIVNGENELTEYYNCDFIKQFVGTEKYTNYYQICIDKSEYVKDMSDYLKAYQTQTATNIYKSNKNEPLLNGAIGNAIAGSVVGGIAAAYTYNKNKSDYNSAITRIETQNNVSNAIMNNEIHKIKKIIDYWKNKNVELINNDEIKSYIKFEIIDWTALKYGNISLTVKIRQEQAVDINGKNAVLDGTIEVEVYDKNELIGNGYIIGKGYGSESTKKVGFNENDIYNVICKIHKEISDIKCLEFKFLPMNIWKIEI